MAAATPSTRRDAVRNREALVAAASSAFREEGVGVSVNEIARAAGVNVATLYRHFPTKDHLVAAALEAVLQPMVDARDRALAADEPGATLARFVRDTARLQGEHRGIVSALGHRDEGADPRRELRERAVAIVAPVVERAHRDGELRAECDVLDVLIVIRALGTVVGYPELEPGRAERLVEVVLRGLRPDVA